VSATVHARAAERLNSPPRHQCVRQRPARSTRGASRNGRGEGRRCRALPGAGPFLRRLSILYQPERENRSLYAQTVPARSAKVRQGYSILLCRAEQQARGCQHENEVGTSGPLNGIQEVDGSIPFSSTNTSLPLARDLRLLAHRRATRPDAASIARLIPSLRSRSRGARLLPR
jgi:hypothetical protein